MPRTLVPLAFLALIAPAIAANQTPASSAHPAASAHANAVSGQNNAARLEACAQAARNFLDHLAQGDFKAATANFDANMHSLLDSGKLGEAWQSIEAKFGKFKALGPSQNVIYQGMPVVTTPLHFANGDLAAQLACDKTGRFAGLHLLPVAAAAPAPATSAR